MDLRPDSPNKQNPGLLVLALIDQQNRQTESALNKLQRYFRSSDPDSRDAAVLQEILRLTIQLRRKQEHLRYARFGHELPLTDGSICLKTAVALTDARDYRTAAEYYRKWLNLNTDQPVSYLQLLVRVEMGRLLHLSKQYPAAAEQFRLVLSGLEAEQLAPRDRELLLRNPDSTYRMMQEAFLHVGDASLARKMMERINLDPSAPATLLNQAYLDFLDGNYDSARKSVLKFIRKRPNHRAAYSLLRDIHFRLSDTDGMTPNQQLIIDLESLRAHPETGSVLDDQLVNTYLQAARTIKARKILIEQRQGSLARDPANRRLLEIAIQQSDLPIVIDCLRIEGNEHPDFSAVRMILTRESASLTSLVRKWAPEANVLPDAIQKRPLDEQVAAARLLLAADRKHLSRILIGQVLEQLRPDAMSLGPRRKLHRSMQLARMAMQIPDHRLALRCLVNAQKLNRIDDQTWLDRDTDLQTLLLIARCQVQLGHADRTQQVIAEAERRFPAMPPVWHLKAWEALQNRDYSRAIIDYTRYLSRFDRPGAVPGLNRLNERARLELGLVFHLLGKPEIALEMLEVCMDRNPFGPDLDTDSCIVA